MYGPTDAEITAKLDSEIQKLLQSEMEMELDEEDLEDDSVMEEIEEDAKKLVAAMPKLDKDDKMFFLAYGLEPVIGKELRIYVIRQQLHKAYDDLKLVETGVKPTSMGKIDVMKNAAKQFIGERFDRHPDAKVYAYQFDDIVELMTADISKDGLLQAVDRLYPRNGTNIFAALDVALKELKRSPSPMALHQIVLVTDGETSEGEWIEKELLPRMKAQGVVLDFIFIVGSGMWSNHYQESTAALKRVCKETGGEFTQVDTPSDLTQKFLKAAHRLMIPARV